MTQIVSDMKLSDYILAGMKLTRPVAGRYFIEDGPSLRACAIGAACLAKDPQVRDRFSFPHDEEGVSQELFPELLVQVRCTVPIAYHREQDWYLQDLIAYLNDVAKWRRDRIARYVAELGY
jgi:hypothetical protein